MTPKHSEDATKREVTFSEYGTHKLIIGAAGAPMSGHLRVTDQATIDALREAFEKAGWTVIDRAA